MKRDFFHRVPRVVGRLVSVRERARVSAGGRLRCAQDWTPASAGDADQGVRFHSGCCNTNGVTLGLVPGVLVDGFAGMDAESSRCANRDSRGEPENDSVGGVRFQKLNAGRRLGQSGDTGLRVPITLSCSPPHPKRCSGALHEAHAQHQHRFDPAIERRRGSESV